MGWVDGWGLEGGGGGRSGRWERGEGKMGKGDGKGERGGGWLG